MTTIASPAVDLPGAALDPAIDFINTFGLSNGRPFDDLPHAADAVGWLAEHGLLDVPSAERERVRLTGAAGPAAIRRVHAVRAGLRELVDAVEAGREPSPAAVDAVNEVLGLRESAQLVPGPAGLRLERRREGAPIDRALAELARRVASEFTEGRPERFRICANERCRWVFYDRSRPGSRRWCEMSSCGNRAKAARHRARLKVRGTAAP